MSSWLWWSLAGSILVALIIMVTAFIVMRIKINNIKNEYMPAHIKNEQSKALNRKEAGQLLWDLKEKAKNPISDSEIEFAINSMVRNDYKTFSHSGAHEYELKSLVKLAKAKSFKSKYDFYLVMQKENIINRFEEGFKNLNKGGMMFFSNMPKKSKRTKELINHLKVNKNKYDYEKIGKGVVLVVK